MKAVSVGISKASKASLLMGTNSAIGCGEKIRSGNGVGGGRGIEFGTESS
jgi:hypothetical protein